MPTITPTLFTDITDTLARHAITLTITRKRVKNINFRVKVNTLKVSAPYYASDEDIIKALAKRLDWIINAHQDLLNKQQANPYSQTDFNTQTNSNTQNNSALPKPLILWGQTQASHVNEKERLQIYRTQLKAVMPGLFDKWQPIVGKTANEQRIKKMKTRWGSCNSRAKRIWLSVYLPEQRPCQTIKSGMAYWQTRQDNTEFTIPVYEDQFTVSSVCKGACSRFLNSLEISSIIV